MAATFSVTRQINLTVLESISGADTSNPDLTFKALNLDNSSAPWTASTTPAVTKHSLSTSVALSSGTYTIDLTSLPGITADEVVTMTGLKLTAIIITNPSTNANKMVFAKGASNGFQIDGATTWSIPLAPGQSFVIDGQGLSDTVGSTKKTIDVTGTGAQTFKIQLLFG